MLLWKRKENVSENVEVNFLSVNFSLFTKVYSQLRFFKNNNFIFLVLKTTTINSPTCLPTLESALELMAASMNVA